MQINGLHKLRTILSEVVLVVDNPCRYSFINNVFHLKYLLSLGSISSNIYIIYISQGLYPVL